MRMKKIKSILIIFLILILFFTFIYSCGKKVDTNNSNTSNRKEAPDFTLSTLDGGVIRLSDFKGRVVLIDFWAEWCGPCKRATPTIASLYKKYKNSDFIVFGINLDDKKDLDKVINYVKEHGIEYPTLIDGFSVASKYNVTGIPKFILIDKNGKIALEVVGARDDLESLLKSNIEKLLKE